MPIWKSQKKCPLIANSAFFWCNILNKKEILLWSDEMQGRTSAFECQNRCIIFTRHMNTLLKEFHKDNKYIAVSVKVKIKKDLLEEKDRISKIYVGRKMEILKEVK